MALLNLYNSCKDTSKLIGQNKKYKIDNIQDVIDILTANRLEATYNQSTPTPLVDQQQRPHKKRLYSRRESPAAFQLKPHDYPEFRNAYPTVVGAGAGAGAATSATIDDPNSPPCGLFKMSRSLMTNQMPLTPPPLPIYNGGSPSDSNFIADLEDMDDPSTRKIPYLWNGILPHQRSHRITTYSQKVFVGGIPWDMSEETLNKLFEPFGRIRVEWPRRDKHAVQPKGYAYVIFEGEGKVRDLLAACTCSKFCSATAGNYFFHISCGRTRAKQIEVIPWIISDSNYVTSTHQKLNPSKTVFVGALHGKLTAEGLAKIMNDMFDGVVYAGIDTDKYKYPIGSGRVTFNNSRSYMKAVSAGFIKIKTTLFTKTIQVDPYLEDTLCALCGVQHGPYFCRELACFRYFCRTCWQWQHSFYDFKLHKPLTRSSRSDTLIGFDVGSP